MTGLALRNGPRTYDAWSKVVGRFGVLVYSLLVFSSAIGRLRLVGMAEGVSFLVLLGVAMPLKYLAGIPLAVKIVGWLHGALFIAFCAVLVRVASAQGWSFRETAIPFVAALIPFGPFAIDGRLRRKETQRQDG